MSCHLPPFWRPGWKPGPQLAFMVALQLLAALAMGPQSSGADLATFDYRVVGTALRPVPEVVTVPRNLPGSLHVQFLRGDGSVATDLAATLAGARLEGTLRGPSYPAQRVVGEPGQPLVLPALRVAGDYQLEDLRAVQPDGTFLAATPSTVAVKVFDEVLVSKVTSRPLDLDEIRARGIAIDESSFRAVEFDVTLVLQGRRVPVHFPVVAPTFKSSTEIIPAAELEDRSVQAEIINRELLRTVVLPPELQVAMPDFTIAPIHFEQVGDGEDDERKPPQITGLLVIPGNIGSLNQFFSVQLYTENASPEGSGLTVNHLNVTIRLPPGRDTNSPIDDPLRLARVGADKQTRPTLPVTLAGPDGTVGTEDDIVRLQPGETGQAEFLVEGLQEGLHLVSFDLEGDLEGLAAGPLRVRGTASGSVLVRNSTFSFTFTHPRTVRSGEPYEASVTLLNTSDFVQNLVSVSINREALSGTVLMSEKSVELGNLRPGESATATFRFRSQRTGSVLFSNLTTGDGNTTGRLMLTCGVDERGVPLNGDSIGYPTWWTDVPEPVRRAADRVLGQALSAATAARLPEGLIKPGRAIVEQRVIELAEAGQRLRYRDELRRVLVDLGLDWQGGRVFDAGFDQIVRRTDAGREWRQALATAVEDADFAAAPARLGEIGSSLANLGQPWWWAAGPATVELGVTTEPIETADPTGSPPSQAAVYTGARGPWAAAKPGTNVVFTWRTTASLGRAELGFLQVTDTGTAEWLSWALTDLPAGAELTLAPGTNRLASSFLLQTPRGPLAPLVRVLQDEPPRVVTVHQDISVTTDRAWQHCPMPPWNNWGTVVAALFNKPMRPDDVAVPGAFHFADGNGARTVQLQPGGRVALLQLHRGIGTFPPARPRTYQLVSEALPDPRGQAGTPSTNEVALVTGHGASVTGRVLGLDGRPVGGIPVTLIMRDFVGDLCLPVENRAGQVFTDDNGRFDFDFVLADVPFTIAALDTSRLSDAASQEILASLIEAVGRGSPDRARLEELARNATTRDAILQAFNVGEAEQALVAAEGLDRAVYEDLIPLEGGRDQTELNIVLRFRGRGTVAGRVLDERGQPIAGAAVNLYPDIDSRERVRGLFSDANGFYQFAGVPLGTFSLDVATRDRRARTVSDRLLTPGQSLVLDVSVSDVPVVLGSLRGQVLELDGRPHANATVYVALDARGSAASGVVAQTTTDSSGFYQTREVPVTNYVAVAVSSDGLRKGLREVRLAAGGVATANIQLEDSAVVRGIVRFWDGRPAAAARVGGGNRVVRADASGRFELPGVPTGVRSLIAGLNGDEVPDNITRTGSAQVTVLPGGNDEVEIRLGAFGRIRGVVRDGAGRPVPGVRVAIPTVGGFFWVKANASGEYVFNRFGLGAYTVSAPSPPVKPSPEELAAAALDALGSASSSAEVDAAAGLVGDLVNVYAQGTVGRFASPSFDPGTWGFNSATLQFDGETAFADITYLPSASLSGVVLNHQGVPIGAEVQASGFGPNKFGAPSIKQQPPIFSNPSSGAWSASGFLVGPFSVHASSPLLVGQPRIEGLLTPENAHRTNVVLQFPPQKDVTGRIVGTATNPDGSPVTNGMVHIDFTSDYAIVVTNGAFDTQIKLPVRQYAVTVTNLETRLVGQSLLSLEGGRTNFVSVRLLDQGSLRVRVTQADGSPARSALVRLRRLEFPIEREESGAERRVELGTDADGVAEFSGLWEGSWSVLVRHQVGANTLELNAGALVPARGTNLLELRLGTSGTIAGRFLEDGTGAPIAGATVSARLRHENGPVYATAPTDAAGRFALTGLPLDTYFLAARNPVNGREATVPVVLRADPATTNTVAVTLVEAALGEIVGTVFQADGVTRVAGAEVTWAADRSAAVARRVTTGPDGSFRFPGVPVGRFILDAATHGLAPLSMRVTGELTPAATPVRVDLVLPGIGSFEVVVTEPDGSPATNAVVRASGLDGVAGLADTDGAGIARFHDVPLGSRTFTATSRREGQRSSSASAGGQLVRAGETAAVAIRLPGVGRVAGVLKDSRGNLAANARVDLRGLGDNAGLLPRTTLSAADGSFVLEDLRFGDWSLTAVLGAVAAHAGVTLTAENPGASLNLQLAGRGTVVGTVAREDGSELVGAEVTIEFAAPGGGTGFKVVSSGPLGRFVAEDLPLSTDLRLSIFLSAIDGRAFRTTRLLTDGVTNDLGEIRLDQHPPEVTALVPADGATDVVETNRIEVTFNERLDPATILNRAGLYLMAGTNRIAADLSLEDVSGAPGVLTRVFLAPRQPLLSKQAYTLVLLGGDQVTSGGRPAAVGPEDLVHRPLLRTRVTRFTVRDYLPPVVLNEFPSTGAAEVEPAAVVRFEFDEPIDTNRVHLALFSAGGVVVEGRVDVNPNQRLLAFVPLRPLLPNAAHRAELRDVADLAGNVLGPRTNSFTTVDNQGPRIAEFAVAPGQRAVPNATVTLVARLERDEDGAGVDFLRGATSVGFAGEGPAYSAAVRMPDVRVGDEVTFVAVGVDRLGNRGEPRLLTVRLQPNEPPVVTLGRALGDTGPVASGGIVALRLTASDDARLRLVQVEATGAGTNRWLFEPATNRLDQVLTLRLPADFVAGESFVFRASARDDSGAQSIAEPLIVPTSDATPPALSLSGPAEGGRLDPRQPFAVPFTVSDNSAGVSLRMLATVRQQPFEDRTLPLVLRPNTPLVSRLDLDLSSVTNGGSLNLELTALDAAGNSQSVSRAYTIRSVTGPRLERISTWQGFDLPSTNLHSPWLPYLTLHFSKPVRIPADGVEWLLVTNGSGFKATFTTNGSSSVFATFTGDPLPPGSLMTAVVRPGLVDADGNPAQLADGSDFPADGVAVTFPVAGFHGLRATNGTPVVPGQFLVVEVLHDAEFSGWTAAINDLAGAVRFSTSEGSRFLVPVPTNAPSARLQIRAAVANRTPFVLPPVELRFVGRDEDSDGDGLPNGWEADRSGPNRGSRFDPFDPADAGKDFDFDGLDNLTEFRRGTDPYNADTDGDRLADAAESPLRDGCPNAFRADSDGDGFIDGRDEAPCDPGESMTVQPLGIEIPAGVPSTNELRMVLSNLRAAGLEFQSNAPRPPWAVLQPGSTPTADGLLRRVELRPSFANVGEFELPLVMQAFRAGAFVFSNVVVRVSVTKNFNVATTRWKSPVSGDWESAANWTAGVPGAGTNAVIDLPGDYTVTLRQNAFIESVRIGAGPGSGTQTLLLASGSLELNDASAVAPGGVLRQRAVIAGQGALSIAGAWYWETSAETRGTGLVTIETNGVWRVEGPNGRWLRRSVENRGNALIGTNSEVWLDNVTLRNSGTLEVVGIPAPGSGQLWGRIGGRLIHTGTLRLLGSDVVLFQNLIFENRGAVEWPAGTWRLNGSGTNAARLEVPAGGRLEIQGDWTHLPGSFVGGAGSMRFEPGLHEVGGIFEPGGPVEFNATEMHFRNASPAPLRATIFNGNIGFEADQEFATLEFRSGRLSGAGRRTIRQRLDWLGGEIQGAGRVVFGLDAVVNCSGAGRWLRSAVENNGRFEFAGNAEVWFTGGTFLNRGVIRSPGGTSGSGRFWSNTAVPDVVVNEGRIEVAATGETLFSGVRLDNRGTVRIESARLTLAAGGANSGRIELDGPAPVLAIGGAFLHDATSIITGPGAVRFTGGTQDLRAPLDIPQFALAGNTVVTGPAGIRVRSRLDWTGGTLTNAGGLLLDATATAGIGPTGGASVQLNTLLENQGLARLEEGSNLRLDHGLFRNSGRFEAPGGSRLFAFSAPTDGNRFENTGTFAKGTNSISFEGVLFVHRGAFENAGGFLRLDQTTNEAVIEIPAGGQLQVSADAAQGGFAQSPAGSLGGAGGFDFASGLHDLDGTFHPAGPLTNRLGTLTIRQPLTNSAPTLVVSGRVVLGDGGLLGRLDLRDGELTVTNRLEVAGDVAWQGTSLSGPGALRFGPTARVRNTVRSPRLALRLENAGEMSLASPIAFTLAGATWVNEAGGRVLLEGAHTFVNFGVTTNLFLNAGSLVKTNAGIASFGFPVENVGTIEVLGGELTFGRGGRQRGSLVIAAGASLGFQGVEPHVFAPGIQITGAGTIRFQPNTSMQLETDLAFGTTQVNFVSTTTWTGAFRLSNAAGGTMTLQSGITRTGGPLDIGGLLRVERNASLKLDGSLTLLPDARLVNLGVRVNGQSNIRVRPPKGWDDAQVEGIAPDVVLLPAPLRVDEIFLAGPRPELVERQSTAAGETRLHLRWRDDPHVLHQVMSSTDLVHWERVDAGLSEPSPGVYEAVLPVTRASEGLFFQVQRRDAW